MNVVETGTLTQIFLFYFTILYGSITLMIEKPFFPVNFKHINYYLGIIGFSIFFMLAPGAQKFYNDLLYFNYQIWGLIK